MDLQRFLVGCVWMENLWGFKFQGDKPGAIVIGESGLLEEFSCTYSSIAGKSRILILLSI